VDCINLLDLTVPRRASWCHHRPRVAPRPGSKGIAESGTIGTPGRTERANRRPLAPPGVSYRPARDAGTGVGRDQGGAAYRIL